VPADSASCQRLDACCSSGILHTGRGARHFIECSIAVSESKQLVWFPVLAPRTFGIADGSFLPGGADALPRRSGNIFLGARSRAVLRLAPSTCTHVVRRQWVRSHLFHIQLRDTSRKSNLGAAARGVRNQAVRRLPAGQWRRRWGLIRSGRRKSAAASRERSCFIGSGRRREGGPASRRIVGWGVPRPASEVVTRSERKPARFRDNSRR
jgi:hypothetical protein